MCFPFIFIQTITNKYFLACDFKVGGIAVLMGKSEMTIKRRIKENNLFIIVKATLKKFPKFGYYRYL